MLPLDIVIITSHRVHDTLGGVEKFVTLFSSWCQKKGVKVTVLSRVLSLLPVKITRGAVSVPQEQRVKFVKKITLPFPIYYLCLSLFSLAAFIALLKLVKISRMSGNKLMILHSQELNFAAIATVLTGKLLKIPTVIHQHGPYIKLLPTKNMKIIEQSINKLVCKLSDVIIVTDKHTQNYLNRIVNDDEKIYVIPAGVDIHPLKNLKSEYDNNSLDHFKIGYIGRLSPEKNLETLILAFNDFKSIINYPCKLLIVGDGGLRTVLKQLVITLGINKHVEFTGFRTDIKPILSTLDLFVLPSKIEGTPISLLEAMSFGKAIIASNIPAIREILNDEKEAILFDPKSSEQLKKAMLRFYDDSSLRKKFGENAKKKASKYNIDDVCRRIFQVYCESLRKKHLKSYRTLMGLCNVSKHADNRDFAYPKGASKKSVAT